MHLHLSSRRGIILQAILILVIAICAIGVALFIASLGPRASTRSEQHLNSREEAKELRNKSRELWERFIALSDARVDVLPTEDDVKLLENALALREQYVRLSTEQNDEDGLIEEIRKRWHNIKASECRRLSKDAEARGDIASQGKDYAAAELAYSEALALEVRINDEYPLCDIRNVTRLEHLKHQTKLAAGRPIWMSLIAEEEEADKIAAQLSAKTAGRENTEPEADTAAADAQWARAADLYKSAMQKAITLRDAYNGVFPIEYGLANKLDIKHQTALSSPENTLIKKILADARKAASDGDYARAGECWKDIFTRYDEMSKKQPLSDYVRVRLGKAAATFKRAQEDPLEPLRIERDNTLMKPLRADFENRLRELDSTLLSERYDDIGKNVLHILQDAEAAQKQYPHANALDAVTFNRLKFMTAKAADIPNIRRVLTSTLLPLPGKPGARLLRSEVPQALYSLVMDTNPSAVRDELLPVDSVSYYDVERFCERVNWLTALAVRLPTVEEYRLALGAADTFAAQAAQAWSFENSGNTSHSVSAGKPNAHGFADLLGNLSEWTFAASSDGTEAVEIGGNYQDARDSLATLLQKTTLRRDKSRLRGFRIIVDAPAPASTEKR